MQNKPQDLVTMNQTDLEADGDRLREECGVFGIFGHPDAAAITALGLHAYSTADRKQPASFRSTASGSIPSDASVLSVTPSHAAK